MTNHDKTDDEWREILSEAEYRMLRDKGTEPAFTGEYWDLKAGGLYVCAGCGQELFDSAAKYDSGSGWPSFWQPIDKSRVDENTDHTHGMTRAEVVCSRCGGHLGHVFPDGPKPTGLRYCVNSVSLRFVPPEENTGNNE